MNNENALIAEEKDQNFMLEDEGNHEESEFSNTQKSSLPPAIRNADCAYFIRGECLRLSQCSYRHHEWLKTETRRCRYWMNGATCHYTCKFLHPSNPYAATVKQPKPFPPKEGNSMDTKATPCYYYSLGQCVKGDDCKFLHEEGKEGIMNKTSISNGETSGDGKNQDVNAKKPICHFYLQGICNKGLKCPFLHEGPVVDQIQNQKNVILEAEGLEADEKREGITSGKTASEILDRVSVSKTAAKNNIPFLLKKQQPMAHDSTNQQEGIETAKKLLPSNKFVAGVSGTTSNVPVKKINVPVPIKVKKSAVPLKGKDKDVNSKVILKGKEKSAKIKNGSTSTVVPLKPGVKTSTSNSTATLAPKVNVAPTSAPKEVVIADFDEIMRQKQKRLRENPEQQLGTSNQKKSTILTTSHQSNEETLEPTTKKQKVHETSGVTSDVTIPVETTKTKSNSGKTISNSELTNNSNVVEKEISTTTTTTTTIEPQKSSIQNNPVVKNSSPQVVKAPPPTNKAVYDDSDDDDSDDDEEDEEFKNYMASLLK